MTDLSKVADPTLPDALRRVAANLKLLALDVDGVLSDGTLLFSAEGDEIKGFNILDGLGIKQLMSAGVEVAVITGRSSPLTERRVLSLGITHLIQGREDKLVALKSLVSELGLEVDEVAYMGDDLPDLAAIEYAALGVTVPNAHWYVRAHADLCTQTAGGHGAVRELTDLILEARGDLTAALESYRLKEQR